MEGSFLRFSSILVAGVFSMQLLFARHQVSWQLVALPRQLDP